MRRMLVLGCSVVLVGCIDRMILDGTLKSTRDASKAFDTLTDLEVAKLGAGSSLVQLEGMQQLAPDNEDALFLLTQSWAGYGAAFIEDEWEQAVDRGDDDQEVAQATRARAAYERSIRFGTLLMEMRHPGFFAATRNTETLRAYLKPLGKEEAANLLWLGIAWLSRGGVVSERSDIDAELFVAEELLEKSVQLDPTLAYATGLSALAAYHARSPDAELKQSKELFEKSLSMTARKALSVQVLYAQSFACNSHDATLYRQLLDEVIAAPDDVLPEQRLENVIAKRKAKRGRVSEW